MATDPRDFGGTDVPLRIGSLVGIRVFNLNSKLGSLVGPVYDNWEWVPGVNIAMCNRPPYYFDFATMTGSQVPDHKPGSQVCTCGFYAFMDDSKIDYYHDSRAHKWRGMLGIIEGWGRVTYGTRGFRCSHARILALVEPARVDAPKARPCFPVEGECARDVWPTIAHKYAEIPYYHTLLEALMDHPLRGIDNQEVA